MASDIAPLKTSAPASTGRAVAAPLYSIIEIMRILPHRFPFLLVDRLEEMHRPPGPSRVGRKNRAIKNVTFNEPFFTGHFPHRPVMPGVLQVESMAQVAALSCVDLDGPRMDVAIAGINNARFRKPVLPGDTLEIVTEITKDRSQIVVCKCEARVRGEIVCEAEIIAKVFPLDLASAADAIGPASAKGTST